MRKMSELLNGPLANIDEISFANQDVIQLNTLDNLLKCGICYEYFETCVMTDCCHNFCSLCIRKYIQFKNECPVCFKELYDCHLRANRIVDNFIDVFPKIKDRLIRCLRTIKTLKSDTIYISPSKKVVETKTTKTRSSTIDMLSKNDDIVAPLVHKSYSSSVTPEDNEVTVFHSSPQHKVIIPKIFQSPMKKNSPSSGRNVAMVECPVCSVPVPDTNINRHLDDCLIRRKVGTNKKVSTPKRAHLPKLVYRLMSIAQLRKKAIEYGLNSQGDTDALKNRIQRYTAMYNAECDKTNPRPVTEIIRLAEKEEKTLANQKLPKSIFSVPPDDVTCKTELNTQYLKENKKSFQNLIDKVKNRQTSKSEDIYAETSRESLTRSSKPLDYCQPSTSSFNFDRSFAYQNDDMLETHELKVEIPEENPFIKNIITVKTEPLNFNDDDENEEIGSNLSKRRCLSSKRLNFDDQFDVSPIKLEPEIDIYEVTTDDETEKNAKNSTSPIIKRSTRRKNPSKYDPVKKDLRKRKR